MIDIRYIIANSTEGEDRWQLAVDTSVPDVQLPIAVMSPKHILLEFGQGLKRPPFVWFKNKGIETTLSFGMQDHTCFIPWRSIKALYVGDQAIHFAHKKGAQEPPPRPKLSLVG